MRNSLRSNDSERSTVTQFADIPALTAELNGFAERIATLGLPLRWWKSSFAHDVIDRVFRHLHLTVPDELRAFYAWSNTFSTEAREYIPGFGEIEIFGHSVSTYLLCLLNKHGDPDSNIPSDGDRYRRSWFPLGAVYGERHDVIHAVVLDCDVTPQAASPVYLFSRTGRPQLIGPSLLDVVQTWNRLLDIGYWSYDPDAHGWSLHPDKIPSGLRAVAQLAACTTPRRST